MIHSRTREERATYAAALAAYKALRSSATKTALQAAQAAIHAARQQAMRERTAQVQRQREYAAAAAAYFW